MIGHTFLTDVYSRDWTVGKNGDGTDGHPISPGVLCFFSW